MQSNNPSSASTSQESGQNYQNTPPKNRESKKYPYQKTWEQDSRFSRWVRKSKINNSYFYCKICKSDYNCDKIGKYSLTRHADTQKHKKNKINAEQRKHDNKVLKTNRENCSIQNNMLEQGSRNESSTNEDFYSSTTSGLQMPFEQSTGPVTAYQPVGIVQQPTMHACSTSDIILPVKNEINLENELECSSTNLEESIFAIDVVRYCETTMNCSSDTSPITNIISMDTCSTSSSNPLQGSTRIKSIKIKMAWFLAKHNLSLDITEDLKNLMQSVCPDSDIVKHLTLKGTEAHAIISNITGNIAQKTLINTLMKEKFSLIVNETLDVSTKQLVFIARTAVDFKIEDHFLYLISFEELSSNTLLHNNSSIEEYFEKNKIPYKENMIGLAAEATSSIFSTEVLSTSLRIKDIPNLFILKWIRNSFYMCASYACKILPEDFKDFLIRMNSYIQNNKFNRPENVEHFQSCGKEKHDIFVPDITSISFLLPLVQNILQKLTEYTLNNTTVSSKSILEQCSSPTTKLYLEFLKFILTYFNEANLEMQSEVPKLYKLYKHVIHLYKAILDCFIKPELLAQDKEEEEQENELLSLNYESTDSHLPLQKIYLGGNVATLLLKEEFISKLCHNEVMRFQKICKDFYIESITQIRRRFPFGNNDIKRLKSLTFLDPEHLIKKESMTSIAHVGLYFKDICPGDMTELDREWRDLRNIKSLSNYDLTIKAEDFWKDVSEMKKNNLPMFPLLSQFVRSLLVLPHSSAANQKIFLTINMLGASVQNKQIETLQGLLHIQSLNNISEPTEEHLNLFNKIFDN